MLRVLWVRWLSAERKKTLDGRQPGWGINPVAMDEAVVGAATAKWTTAPMKRDDAMKGSWSGTVDERRPSLAVDDGVGVAAPAMWRMGRWTEEAGRSGEVVVTPTVYKWGNGGGISNLGTRLSEMWESYELIPGIKFRTSRQLGIGR